MAHLLHDLRLHWLHWLHWQDRSPRERQLLSLLILFIATASLAQLLWSAHEARQRLGTQIPRLNQQLAVMQQQATDLRHLRTQPLLPQASGTALLTAARNQLSRAGLEIAEQDLVMINTHQLQLRSQLAFNAWLDASAALQQENQLRLLQVRLEAIAAQPGMARIDAVFALPES